MRIGKAVIFIQDDRPDIDILVLSEGLIEWYRELSESRDGSMWQT